MTTEKDVYGQEHDPEWLLREWSYRHPEQPELTQEQLKSAYKALENRTIGNYKPKNKTMKPLTAIKKITFGAAGILVCLALGTLIVKTGWTIVQTIWNLW